MKKTKRKAFNFLRSYFDVFNQLESDKDRLAFLTSIINKQFLNEDPENLEFIPKLCYESQRHSVEKSVNGWILANKTDLKGDPILPHTPPLGSDPKGDPTPPPKEEQEQEKEQEKEEVEEQEPVHEEKDYSSTFDFLKKEKSQLLEIWMMQNKSQIKDPKDFIQKFNVVTEGEILKGDLEWKADILMNRLKRFGIYWISNESKNNKTPEPNSYESGKQPRI